MKSSILFSSILIMTLCNSCAVYRVTEYKDLTVEIPDEFYNREDGEEDACHWWELFDQPLLNEAVDAAIEQNLDIRIAWSRLIQAQYNVCIKESDLYPSINLIGNSIQNDVVNRRRGERDDYLENGIQLVSAYEIDIWNRIGSGVNAAIMQERFSEQQVEEVIRGIIQSVTEFWFFIQEKKSLLRLIDHQIELSKTLLDLVEFRFSVGEASALDVYQQRLQYENTIVQRYPVEQDLLTGSNTLHVLLGIPPGPFLELEKSQVHVTLPEFPFMGTPRDLLCRRAVLRAAYFDLQAADYDVAVAIADLFPRISLPAIANISTRSISHIFQEEILRIGLNLIQPVFDAGKRMCTVNQKKAVVQQKLDTFSLLFLNTLKQVEDTVITERAKIQIVNQLNKEVELAKRYLEEATHRYVNGLNDYLTVINAIQALQALERRVISEYSAMLINRSRMYVALGLNCNLSDYEPSAERTECPESFEDIEYPEVDFTESAWVE